MVVLEFEKDFDGNEDDDDVFEESTDSDTEPTDATAETE